MVTAELGLRRWVALACCVQGALHSRVLWQRPQLERVCALGLAAVGMWAQAMGPGRRGR